MNEYELISPKSGKPCGVFVCGECNIVRPTKDLADKCCKPCACGKPSMNRFDCKCSSCHDMERMERMTRILDKAELVEWDGSSMVFSEEVDGYNDGWFSSPDEILEYLADEEMEFVPEFAFVGWKRIKKLDISRAIEEMTEDTYEGADLHISPYDSISIDLIKAVDAFNEKYSITYYEHDYKKKVRVRESTSDS